MQTLDCIGDLFTGAKAIQNWLNLSARIIAKSIPGERVLATLMKPVPAAVINKAIDKVAEEEELEQKRAEQALLDAQAEAESVMLKELEDFAAPENQDGVATTTNDTPASAAEETVTTAAAAETASDAVSATEGATSSTESQTPVENAEDPETIQLNQSQLKKIMLRLAKERSKHRAERLRKEQMTAVVWTTHLGLPIVQPYRKDKKKQVRILFIVM